MRKPGSDPSNVQMDDVICDFCHREWSAEEPMIEGHQGSCICGKCLTVAYREVVIGKADSATAKYQCTMCLEKEADRAALNRGGEPGWGSPAYPVASICRRCIKLGAASLHKDSDFDWTKPK